jgi:hypothetical protein
MAAQPWIVLLLNKTPGQAQQQKQQIAARRMMHTATAPTDRRTGTAESGR